MASGVGCGPQTRTRVVGIRTRNCSKLLTVIARTRAENCCTICFSYPVRFKLRTRYTGSWKLFFVFFISTQPTHTSWRQQQQLQTACYARVPSDGYTIFINSFARSSSTAEWARQQKTPDPSKALEPYCDFTLGQPPWLKHAIEGP